MDDVKLFFAQIIIQLNLVLHVFLMNDSKIVNSPPLNDFSMTNFLSSIHYFQYHINTNYFL